jgi:hypothetical protein
MATPRTDREAHPGKNGGKRPGAGRPVGSSVHAKLTAKAIESQAGATVGDVVQQKKALIATIQGSKLDPLLALVSMASNPKLPANTRITAAGIAAKYCYPALSATQIDQRVQTVSHADAVAEVAEKLQDILRTTTIEAVPEPAEAAQPVQQLPAPDPQPDLEAVSDAPRLKVVR